MRFQLSRHAIERFRERDGTCKHLDDRTVGARLSAEIERGMPLDAHLGRDRLILLPSGLVAVVSWANGHDVVKTVVTRSMARRDLEARGIQLRWSELAVLMRDAA